MVALAGGVGRIVAEYNKRVVEGARGFVNDTELGGVIRKANLVNEEGTAIGHIALTGTLRIRLELVPVDTLLSPVWVLGFDDLSGQRVLTIHTPLSGRTIEGVSGTSIVECVVPVFHLLPASTGSRWRYRPEVVKSSPWNEQCTYPFWTEMPSEKAVASRVVFVSHLRNGA